MRAQEGGDIPPFSLDPKAVAAWRVERGLEPPPPLKGTPTPASRSSTPARAATPGGAEAGGVREDVRVDLFAARSTPAAFPDPRAEGTPQRYSAEDVEDEGEDEDEDEEELGGQWPEAPFTTSRLVVKIDAIKLEMYQVTTQTWFQAV